MRLNGVPAKVWHGWRSAIANVATVCEARQRSFEEHRMKSSQLDGKINFARYKAILSSIALGLCFAELDQIESRSVQVELEA